MLIIEELKNREILKDITSEQKFKNLNGNEGVYIGFDPTAKSLHLGNYIQIVILKRFLQLGFNSIAILGGATGMIGDPSGKSKERNLIKEEDLIKNRASIKIELEKFNLKVIDNYDFYKNMNVLDFFRNVGKNLNINYMLSKEVISSRMDKGISFTEFSYQLIQGWDFKCLYEKENVRIQIGGSDQWGNITSGIEIIRKIFGDKNSALGITTNLLTTSNGKKFGKSEGNALWLNKKMTTPYQMYQYLISTSDEDVKKFLMWLTFLEIKKIKKIINEHNIEPKKRFAQKILAYEIVKDIHGEKEAKKSQLLTNILYGNTNLKKLNSNDISLLVDSIPTFEKLEGNILEVLINSNLAKSRREAREFIQDKSITINGSVIESEYFEVNSYGYDNLFNIIKRGKKKTILIKNIII